MKDHEIMGLRRLLDWAIITNTPEVADLIVVLRNMLAKYKLNVTTH